MVDWSDKFRERFAGAPLKRIGLSVAEHAVRGEAVITQSGLEGGAVYALAPAVRAVLDDGRGAILHIDLRPDLTIDQLASRLEAPRGKQSLSTYLRKAVKLSPVSIALLQESQLSSEAGLRALSPAELAGLIKRTPVSVSGLAPIAKAISTAGGIAFDGLDDRFMLRRRPGVFVAGEMLDWEAPTGGYLLQACFSTGRAAAHGALAWLDGRADLDRK
jgi:uncharacterized flavoprotein (TIGR03862 family)